MSDSKTRNKVNRRGLADAGPGLVMLDRKLVNARATTLTAEIKQTMQHLCAKRVAENRLLGRGVGCLRSTIASPHPVKRPLSLDCRTSPASRGLTIPRRRPRPSG